MRGSLVFCKDYTGCIWGLYEIYNRFTWGFYGVHTGIMRGLSRGYYLGICGDYGGLCGDYIGEWFSFVRWYQVGCCAAWDYHN